MSCLHPVRRPGPDDGGAVRLWTVKMKMLTQMPYLLKSWRPGMGEKSLSKIGAHAHSARSIIWSNHTSFVSVLPKKPIADDGKVFLEGSRKTPVLYSDTKQFYDANEHDESEDGSTIT